MEGQRDEGKRSRIPEVCSLVFPNPPLGLLFHVMVIIKPRQDGQEDKSKRNSSRGIYCSSTCISRRQFPGRFHSQVSGQSNLI
jgi:hypothetical protein